MTVEAKKVKVFADASGAWRWTASDDNNRKVATSGEGYESKSYAKQAAQDLFPDAILSEDDGTQSE